MSEKLLSVEEIGAMEKMLPPDSPSRRLCATARVGARAVMQPTDQEVADAANDDLKGVTALSEVFDSPRFAFVWGFARGVEWMYLRLTDPTEESKP